MNSDVINAMIDNKPVAITDIIEIDNVSQSNIDMGLIELENVDLKLDKYIKKVTIQNAQGVTVYNYDKEKLAKVEIAAKNINNTIAIVEYEIVVTNCGEVDSYVTEIVDYVSGEFKFNSELNKQWYYSGDYLYNSSLSNTKIAPGESKTLNLILTKTINENNTGLINNTAEISEQYNELGLPDNNSTPNNKVQGENDMSSADIIFSIKTGKVMKFIGITLSGITMIAIGGYIIFKKVIKG